MRSESDKQRFGRGNNKTPWIKKGHRHQTHSASICERHKSNTNANLEKYIMMKLWPNKITCYFTWIQSSPVQPRWADGHTHIRQASALGFISFIHNGGHLEHKLEGTFLAIHPPWSQLWPGSACNNEHTACFFSRVGVTSRGCDDCDCSSWRIFSPKMSSTKTHWRHSLVLLLQSAVSSLLPPTKRGCVELGWTKTAHLQDMMQDCIKTIGNITTVNATTFLSNHSMPHARA